MLNVMLNPSPQSNGLEDLTVINDEKNQIQLVVQNKKNHENLLLKNNFYKHNEGGYFMFIHQEAIASVIFETNENFEIISKVNVMNQNYKFLIEHLMEGIMYN